MNRKYIVAPALVAALFGAFVYLYGGSRAPSGQPPLEDLTAQNLDEIANAFNAAKGDVRVLLLLSPTCPVCLEGASVSERILRAFPGKRVRAFVVWEPVLITDWSSPSSNTLSRISDPRASQFWDRGRLISHLMGEHSRRSVVWDHIAVYAPGAIWRQRPPQAIFAGGPVVRVEGQARSALGQALQEIQKPQR